MKRWLHPSRILLLVCLLALAGAGIAQKRSWRPLANDGVHDPKSPAIGVLQEPAQALLN